MITTDEMRTRLDDATADAGRLKVLTEGAHAFVERQTGRSFRKEASSTVYLCGDGTRRLWLPEPVSGGGVSSVEERQYPGDTGTAFTENDEYAVRTDRETQLVRLGGYLWRDGYEYAVTYSFGYVETDAATATSAAGIAAPDEIRDLVAGLVAFKYQLAGHEGLRSETLGGYSYTRFNGDDLDAIPGARDTIEAWHRPVFA